MRLLTYNIFWGGKTAFESHSRLDCIVDVIKSQSPDVVALQELQGFGEKKLSNLAERLELPYSAFAWSQPTCHGDRYNVGTISRFPIQESTQVPGFNRACLQTVLETDLGSLSLCNIHLKSWGEEIRVQEVKQVVKVQAGHPLAIVCGDFNALSSKDSYDLEKFHPDLFEGFVEDGKVCGTTVDVIERAGFVDGARHCNSARFTCPTPKGYYFGRGELRIDYVWVSPQLVPRLERVDVVCGGLAERASDHYPLLAVFK